MIPARMPPRAIQRIGRRTTEAEEYISQREAARRAGCSLSTIHRACLRYEASHGRDGLGPVLRRGWRFVRVPVSAFERWMGAAAVF